MPKMTHKDSKQTLDVSPDQVPMYRSQGWREKDSKSSAAEKKAESSK